MVIKTIGWKCGCGCNKFYHLGYGSDGACESWVNIQCKKCNNHYELWDSSGITWKEVK